MHAHRSTFHAMPSKSKRDITAPVRLTPEFRQAVKTLPETHKAKNASEYFRGLIYLDALLATGDADLLDKPAWVTRDYGELARELTSRKSKNAKG